MILGCFGFYHLISKFVNFLFIYKMASCFVHFVSIWGENELCLLRHCFYRIISNNYLLVHVLVMYRFQKPNRVSHVKIDGELMMDRIVYSSLKLHFWNI